MADTYMGASMKHQICLFWTQELILFIFLCTLSRTYPMFSLMRIFYDQKTCCTYYFYPGSRKLTFFDGFGLKNDPDLTLNLNSRSSFETRLVLFNSLIFGKCNKGSLVTVSCSVQIFWWIVLPLYPINFLY